MVSRGELLSAEEQERKGAWLRDLADFIVEANQNTYAAGRGQVAAERPGYKELEFSRGPWRLRDSYTKHYRAPGMTTVYFKEDPSWTMAYGGLGMVAEHYDLVKPTYSFLKASLMKVTPESPYRGPEVYRDGEWLYLLKLKPGSDLTDFQWDEYIYNLGKGVLTFTQTGFGGITVGKATKEDGEIVPVFPWNL